MHGHLGAATMQLSRFQTPRSIVIDESPTDSQHTYYPRLKSVSPLFWMNNFFSPRSYNFVFCVPLNGSCNERMRTKWYTINIRADGSGKLYLEDKPLASFWDGELAVFEGFAALGSHVYCFGGLSYPISLPDVHKLDVTPGGTHSWNPVCPMISPRLRPLNHVFDGKIYVFSGHREYLSKRDIPPTSRWGEVFHPDNGQWEGLPDPPNYSGSSTIISAALENPNRILVAFPAASAKPRTVTFFTYNVKHQSWEMLEPTERKIHPNYPIGSRQRAVTLHNTLYWVTHIANEISLLAYNLDLDVWLEGHLKGLGILLFEDEEYCYILPHLFHLEKQRFCLLQSSSDGYFAPDGDLHCVAVDISPMPGKSRLVISLAWQRKYKIDCPNQLSDCLLLPEIKQEELQGAN